MGITKILLKKYCMAQIMAVNFFLWIEISRDKKIAFIPLNEYLVYPVYDQYYLLNRGRYEFIVNGTAWCTGCDIGKEMRVQTFVYDFC